MLETVTSSSNASVQAAIIDFVEWNTTRATTGDLSALQSLPLQFDRIGSITILLRILSDIADAPSSLDIKDAAKVILQKLMALPSLEIYSMEQELSKSPSMHPMWSFRFWQTDTNSASLVRPGQIISLFLSGRRDYLSPAWRIPRHIKTRSYRSERRR